MRTRTNNGGKEFFYGYENRESSRPKLDDTSFYDDDDDDEVEVLDASEPGCLIQWVGSLIRSKALLVEDSIFCDRRLQILAPSTVPTDLIDPIEPMRQHRKSHQFKIPWPQTYSDVTHR